MKREAKNFSLFLNTKAYVITTRPSNIWRSK
ncbi:MAG: hypothetical protein RJB42_987, partial [Bacteroidota bacterium]